MNSFKENRPNPDELLASLYHEHEKSKLGELKIFFGMCAGVGKTYSMLRAGISEKSKGIDIIIGYVETHNRIETAELVKDFEVVPRKSVTYKNTSVQEMDLDAIIARKPQIVLVDELAHTNIPGSRHTKRYHDVLELLENGINVYTTLNVQHLESRSEIVSQITGIKIRETVPDEIFENATDIELVDLTTVELLQRLSEGKIYSPERSKEAIENFFRKGNITALREMALRIVADRVDIQLHDYMQNQRIRGPWKSSLHMLVAINSSSDSEKLLRWSKNLSYSMGASIQALYVEPSRDLSKKEQLQLDKNIQLAKQLGIKLRIITHYDVVRAIIDFAHKENITHIVVGKTSTHSLFSLLKLGNFVNRLIRDCGNIDVYILGSDNTFSENFKNTISFPKFTSHIVQYLIILLLVTFTSFICYLFSSIIGYQVVSFVLLFLVSILALFFSTGPIFFAATISSLIWNYFFIPPYFTLYIEKPIDFLMFIMFFIIVLLNGILTSRLKRQEKKIRIREERTNALYQLAKDLSSALGMEEVHKVVVNDIQKYFHLNCKILLLKESDTFEFGETQDSTIKLSENDYSVANWVYKNSSKAGKYTETLPLCEYTFYPLLRNNGNIGVIVVKHASKFTYGEEQLWEAFVSQISGKFEREFLREDAKRLFLTRESEKIYKTMFDSISHELKIPVTTILSASEALLSQEYPEKIQKQLCTEINIASIRLERLIENLLNMSRIESSQIKLHLDWCDIHDLTNSVLKSLTQELKNFKISLIIPSNFPLIKIDFGLIQEVIYNLLLNATQYSSAQSSIKLKYFMDNGVFTLMVMDRGPGFTESELKSIFNKFYRGNEGIKEGSGLGLSIAKRIIEAHNGTIVAENRKNGGALFTIKIPLETSTLNN